MHLKFYNNKDYLVYKKKKKKKKDTLKNITVCYHANQSSIHILKEILKIKIDSLSTRYQGFCLRKKKGMSEVFKGLCLQEMLTTVTIKI